MANEIKMEGLEELILTLEKMGSEGERIAALAVTAGGKVILNRMKGKIYSVLNKRTGKGQQGLTMSQPIEDKKGGTAVFVGVGPEDISEVYYLKFSEYGSSHEPAKPWMRPAFDEAKEEAIKEMENVAGNEIAKTFYGKGR